MCFQYATGMCLLLENVGGYEQNRSVIANVQSDDLWPSRMHAATHILHEKIHACGVLKRHNFRVHVSLDSAEILVRRGGIINHHSIAYSLSNISAKNYRNRLMWVESIVCNVSVVFLRHSVCARRTELGLIYPLLNSISDSKAIGKYSLPGHSDCILFVLGVIGRCTGAYVLHVSLLCYLITAVIIRGPQCTRPRPWASRTRSKFLALRPRVDIPELQCIISTVSMNILLGL